MESRRTTKAPRVLAVGTCALCATVALAASAGAGPLARGSNSQTYTDPAGDADGGVAPDLTTVEVSNDDEGTLKFRVAVPNRTAWAPDDFVGVYLNTDGNTATGCANTHGGDYTLTFLGKAATIENFVVLLHCKGGDFDPETLQGSFTGAVDLAGRALTFSVNRRDIGSPKRITMFLISTSQDASYLDIAPDSGDWTYDVVAPAAPTYRDAFGQDGQAKPHAATIPTKARAVQVVVRWKNPADRFDIAGVEVVDGNRTASPARIVRVRRPDKLCSPAGCRTRRGTSLLVDVAGIPAPRTTSALHSAGPGTVAARRKIRFTVRGKKVTQRTNVRTEVVSKGGKG